MTYECIVWQSSMLKMRNENKSINLISAGKSDFKSCAASLFRKNPSAAFCRIKKYSNLCLSTAHTTLPHSLESTQTVYDERGKTGKGCERISFLHPQHQKFSYFSHTNSHTEGELFGVDGNEKKSKPFGSRRRAKAFWGCVKGVRVRICDKKWLYGSCTLKSFSFREKSMCRLLVAVKDSKSRNRKWTEWKFEFFSGK
jgi:hypothetical protein